MKNILFLSFYFFNLIFCQLLISQNSHKAIIGQIESIGKNIPNKTKDSTYQITIENEKFKQVIKGIKRDDFLLLAVANSKAGKELNTKQYYKEADYFYKKSFKYRKKIGKYVPIRWALKSLYTNSLKGKQFNNSFKYTKLWMRYLKANLNDTTWKKAYRKSYWKYTSPDEIYYGDFISRIKEIGDLENSWSQPDYPEKEVEKRYTIALKMLKYYLKNYQSEKDIFDDRYATSYIKIFSPIITHYIQEENIEKAKFWENTTLKTLKKSRNKIEYTDHIRFLSILYRDKKKSENYEILEREGIRVMNMYASECEKIKRYDQVGFGLRYNGLRYLKLKSYNESLQMFVDAINKCYELKTHDDIKKAYGGIHKILQSIVKEQDSVSWSKLINWKENLNLKDLPENEIKKIDDKISNLDFSQFYEIQENSFGSKVAEGLFKNGKKEGIWISYNFLGEKFKEVNYKSGLEEGESIIYGRDEKIVGKEYFIKGTKEGDFKYWYPSGKLKQTITYLNGKKEGKSILYSEEGKIIRKIPFKNDLRHGIEYFYFEDGTVLKYFTFDNNVMEGKAEFFYEGNKKAQVLNYKDNKLEGIQYYYDEAGKFSAQLVYKNNLQDGETLFFDSQGYKFKTEIWKEGKLIDTIEH